MEGIIDLLASTGWEIIGNRYWMTMLKPVVIFRRKFMNGNFTTETKLPARLLNQMLYSLVAIENFVSIIGKFKGTSIFIVAKKSQEKSL
jgi:hypothetical protein